jgi:hypothetical protein
MLSPSRLPDKIVMAEFFCTDYLDFQMQGKAESDHRRRFFRFTGLAISFVVESGRVVLSARDLDKGMKPSRRKLFNVKPSRGFGSLPGAFRN